MGEELAAQALTQDGYAIIDRNYKNRWCEIDIIATKGSTVYFVEVKFRTSDAFGYPEDFVDYKKSKNIVDGAEQYTFDKNWQGNVRYDIIAIRNIQGQLEIKHIEDAFYYF